MSVIEGGLPALILGAGGHAKVLIEALRLNQKNIIGVVTPELDSGASFYGLPVIGSDKAIQNYDPQELLLINGLGSLPGNSQRWKLSVEMREKGYQFGSVVHPYSKISTDIVLEEGVQLMAGTVIQPGCKIGQCSIINTGSLIDHDSVIGEYCHIAPGVTLSGGVSVGESVHIGAGSQVIQGIQIGDNAVIAAGTTVYKDVPNGMLVRQKLEIEMELFKG